MHFSTPLNQNEAHVKNLICEINLKIMKLTFEHLDLLKTFQNRRVSSPAPVTIASPSGETAKYKTRKL